MNSVASFLKNLQISLFHLMIVTVPFAFTFVNEELFEFNKMLLVYVYTLLIVGTWATRMIISKKVLITKTILDWPILAFLASQVLSTAFSMHPWTSVFGYYTRFHGGLLSTICYILLYYAFTSTFTKKHLFPFFISLMIAAAGVSLYAIPEHFGASPSCALISGSWNVECWVQRVQERVFGTFGQPNWLAAYAITLLPVLWSMLAIENWDKNWPKIPNWLIQSFLLLSSWMLMATLLFTKSRSGFIGLIIGVGLFALGLGWIYFQKLFLSKNQFATTFKKEFKNFSLLTLGLILGILALIGWHGSPLTPPISSLLPISESEVISPLEDQDAPEVETAPVNRLEVGGTDSWEIRKIVWEGAIAIGKRYPLLGSGVETFAYSYYLDRPAAHNTVSEWDFLYNKAHNEFLNFFATTGILGLGTYVVMLAWFSLVSLEKIIDWKKTPDLKIEDRVLILGLLAGITALSISNFSGFSTVMVTVLMFLYFAILVIVRDNPAQKLTSSLSQKTTGHRSNDQLSLLQLGQIAAVIITIIYCLSTIWSIWLADKKYAVGQATLKAGYIQAGLDNLESAVELRPGEAVYHDELGSSYAKLAVLFNDEGQSTQSALFAQAALQENQQGLLKNPVHLNFYKSRIQILTYLSVIDPRYLEAAQKTAETALELSPTDAKLWYNLGRIEKSLGNQSKALEIWKKTVELKPNYEAAQLDLAQLYFELQQPDEAKIHLEILLKHINPNNEQAQELLEKITN